MKKRKKALMLTALSFAFFTGTIQAQQENSADTNLTPYDSTKQKTTVDPDKLVLSETELDDESDDNMQNISGLLNSGKDPFESATRYNLSGFRFRPRGYDGEYENVYINGALFNEAEGGRFVYSLIGGLNDATRNQESTIGIEPSTYSYGNLGGSTNIDMRASQYGRGTKISLSGSNQSYNARVMATYSTGLLKNGWAFSLTGSRRMTFEGKEYVKGAFYDAWALAFAAEKKLGKKNSLTFNVLYAPVKRGMQGAATQEAFDLTGTNYYNPNWGYQNGEVRNAKVSNTKAPIAILKHEWKRNENFKLNTALGLKYSNSSTTALNWYNSEDPRPDYYRYFPSYFTTESPETASLLTSAWQTDESTQQINWDNLYQINYLANQAGLSARYIVEEKHNDQLAANLNSTANWKVNKHINLDGGIHASTTKGMHYKKMNDLLGADYWVDIDQFSERDFKGNSTLLQNDLNNPDRQIRVGDIFGYNYNIFVNKADAWANTKFNFNKIDFYVSGSCTGTQFYREGLMKNGRAPENSYGVGVKHNFLDYSAKGGITYKLTGRHIFTLNTMYQTNAPSARNAYISANTKDDVITGLKSEKVFSADLNYYLRLPNFTGRVTAYRTQFKDQSELSSFYSDDYKTFVNEALIGINKTHQGIEVGIEAKINAVITAYGAASLGQYLYTSRPTAVTSYENGAFNDTVQTVFLKNFFVNGTPQTAGTVGLKFSLPKFWFIDINSNYCSRSYIDIFTERRTSAAIAYDMTDAQIEALTKQEELNGGFTFDVSVGKSWRIMQKYFLSFNISVNNILDNKSIQTSGYEQSRMDTDTHEAFPSKYYYGFGRTWMAMLGFKF